MRKWNRKAINFDLDTKKLKESYPSKNWLKAYKDIKAFMKSNGFSHRQWSGYQSEKPMSDTQILMITQMMNIKFPWLKNCIRYFDVTDIGKNYDLTHIFSDKCSMKKIDIKKTKPPKEGRNLTELMIEARKEKLAYDKQKAQQIIKEVNKHRDNGAR